MLPISTELNLIMQKKGTTIQMQFGMMNNPAKDDQSTSLNTSPAWHKSVAISVKRIVFALVIVQTTSPDISEVRLDLPC